MRTVSAFLLLLALCLLLPACGNKGELVRPAPQGSAQAG
jgi:predicted small lipoprotein YifL